MIKFIWLMLGMWVSQVHAVPTPLMLGTTQQPMKACSLVFDNPIVLRDILLAETQQQRQVGLSGQKKVATGMLFVVARPQILSFWMKDTRIALSIGFFNEEGVLFQIEDMWPETKEAHVSKQKAIKALELPMGKFGEYGLKVGSRLLNMQCK